LTQNQPPFGLPVRVRLVVLLLKQGVTMSCNPWICNDKNCEYCNSTPHKKSRRARVANHKLLERIEELETLIDNYECIMYAAALEIERCWKIHTDEDGLGPMTLINLLKLRRKPRENPYPQFSKRIIDDSQES
jgi:hypothetical protein